MAVARIVLRVGWLARSEEDPGSREPAESWKAWQKRRKKASQSTYVVQAAVAAHLDGSCVPGSVCMHAVAEDWHGVDASGYFDPCAGVVAT